MHFLVSSVRDEDRCETGLEDDNFGGRRFCCTRFNAEVYRTELDGVEAEIWKKTCEVISRKSLDEFLSEISWNYKYLEYYNIL